MNFVFGIQHQPFEDSSETTLVSLVGSSYSSQSSAGKRKDRVGFPEFGVFLETTTALREWEGYV
jgi:hypothetical protein